MDSSLIDVRVGGGGRGLNWFYWCQIFALESVVVKAQKYKNDDFQDGMALYSICMNPFQDGLDGPNSHVFFVYRQCYHILASRYYKTVFMLNSTEHKISTNHKT